MRSKSSESQSVLFYFLVQGSWHDLLAQDKIAFFNAHVLDENARWTKEPVVIQPEPQALITKSAEKLELLDLQLSTPIFQQNKTPILLRDSSCGPKSCSDCEFYKLQLIRSHLMNQSFESLLYDLESRRLEEIIKYKTLYEALAVELKNIKHGNEGAGKTCPTSDLSDERSFEKKKTCIKRGIMDMMEIFQQQGSLPSWESSSKLDASRRKEKEGLFIDCALALEQRMEGLLSNIEEEQIKSRCLEESVSLLKSQVIRFKSLFLESETQKRKLLLSEREQREEMEAKIDALLNGTNKDRADASTQCVSTWFTNFHEGISQRDGIVSAQSHRASEISPSDVGGFRKPASGEENLSPSLSHRRLERNYETEKKPKHLERIMSSNALSLKKMPTAKDANLGSCKDLGTLTRSQALRRK